MDFKHELQVVEGDLIGKVETKVKAASTAAAITGLGLSLLGHYVFQGAVPEWAQAIVDTGVTGGLTFAAGWLAKHTPRTVAPVTPPAPPAPPAAAVK